MSPMPIPSRKDLEARFRGSAQREAQYAEQEDWISRRVFWRVTIPGVALLAGWGAIKMLARLRRQPAGRAEREGLSGPGSAAQRTRPP
jgi:hypothetical protein